jgi:hypothetical protein
MGDVTKNPFSSTGTVDILLSYVLYFRLSTVVSTVNLKHSNVGCLLLILYCTFCRMLVQVCRTAAHQDNQDNTWYRAVRPLGRTVLVLAGSTAAHLDYRDRPKPDECTQ